MNNEIVFNDEQRLAHSLIFSFRDAFDSVGLLNGDMGVVLALAIYARKRNQRMIKRISEHMLEVIIQRVNRLTPICLADGIAGLGWGIEYMIQNNYIDANGADLLWQIDNCIMEWDINRITDYSFAHGVEGLLHYVLIHIQGAKKQNSSVFDSRYIDSWAQWVDGYLQNGNNQTLLKLANIFKMLNEPNYNDIAYAIGPTEFISDTMGPMRPQSLSNGYAGRLLTTLREASLRKT